MMKAKKKKKNEKKKKKMKKKAKKNKKEREAKKQEEEDLKDQIAVGRWHAGSARVFTGESPTEVRTISLNDRLNAFHELLWCTFKITQFHKLLYKILQDTPRSSLVEQMSCRTL